MLKVHVREIRLHWVVDASDIVTKGIQIKRKYIQFIIDIICAIN